MKGDEKRIARLLWGLLLLGAVAGIAHDASFVGGPTLLSPAAAGGEARVGTACPTFSWTNVPGAQGYQLLVYEVSEGGGAGRQPSQAPVLRKDLPQGAFSWTPSLEQCLASSGRYGWSVGARLGGEEKLRWSRPALFRVEAAGRSEEGVPRPSIATVEPPPATAVTLPPAERAPTAGAKAAAPAPRVLVGDAYVPPPCGAGLGFVDVQPDDPFCRWIEQLARDGISEGCGPGNFCPDNAVSRKQLAMVVERAMRGTPTWSPAQGSNVVAPPAGNNLTTVDDPPSNQVGWSVSITIGVDGLPILSYADVTANALKVAHCNDLACTGQDEMITTVDDPPANSVGQANSITVGADGLPIISYHDDTTGALRVAHCNDLACAGQDETIAVVDDPANVVAWSTSITIGADGLAIIAYSDNTAYALKVAHCNDLACAGQNETITTVDDMTNSFGPQSTSIAIGADGLPIISYFDDAASTLKVAHCNDLACAGQNETITTVDDPANLVGNQSSITIGADGLPVISYYDLTADSLKVAHCNDVACAGQNETITTVDDPTNEVGRATSITIGADGLPIISYIDETADLLKLVHCNDVACAGQDETITTVDDPGNWIGYSTSITIGADGLPIIGYYNLGAGTLKVAHCANVFCTPYFRRR